MPSTKRSRKLVKNAPLTNGVNQTRLAQALALADLSGPSVAASKFSMSVRSIRRYQARLKKGELPQLAGLVTTAASTIAEDTRDLLDAVFEAYLNRMKELAKTATHAQAAVLFEKLAEVKLTRESLANGHVEPGPVSNQTGAVNTGPIFQILKPAV